MADVITTTSTTGALLKQYWHKFFLTTLEDNLLMKDLGLRGKVAGKSGTTVHFYRIENVDAAPTITEGVDPAAQSARATDITATLKQYGQLVSPSDLFLDTSIDGSLQQILERLAYNAAKTIDSEILNVVLGGTTVSYAGGAVARNSIAANNTATITEIRKAVRLLENSSAPTFPDGFFRGIVVPDVKFWIKFLTSLNLSNSGELPQGQSRAKLFLREGVTTIREIIHKELKIWSELYSNIKRMIAISFRSLNLCFAT